MRRPLKPFVTEYKGTRRPSQGQQQGFGPALTTDPEAADPPVPQASQVWGPRGSETQGSTPRGQRDSFPSESERSRAKPFESTARPDSEDSYEAAMRAADALFARPIAPEPVRHAAPPKIHTEPDAEELQPTAAATERGGRILRAIDEAPPPQFAALEAAYAPKRRGRKPGSKNKPKVPATSGADAPPADLQLADLPLDRTPQPALVDPTFAAPRPAAAAPAMQQLEGIAVSDETAPKGALRGERRAPWLRDRLKPGEGWKRRRLPRVCW